MLVKQKIPVREFFYCPHLITQGRESLSDRMRGRRLCKRIVHESLCCSGTESEKYAGSVALDPATVIRAVSLCVDLFDFIPQSGASRLGRHVSRSGQQDEVVDGLPVTIATVAVIPATARASPVVQAPGLGPARVKPRASNCSRTRFERVLMMGMCPPIEQRDRA